MSFELNKLKIDKKKCSLIKIEDVNFNVVYGDNSFHLLYQVKIKLLKIYLQFLRCHYLMFSVMETEQQ